MSEVQSDKPQEASTLVKVHFPLPPDDQAQGVSAENLWAVPLGESYFQIDNIPFYVYGISVKDVVLADQIEGRLSFREVMTRGGHSTYRVLVKNQSGYEDHGFQRLWTKLSELGCSHEVAERRWIAIDVPPDTDICQVYRLLEDGEAQGIWTFEEAHCAH
jgi:Domain of unknown function (DUF4265)